MKFQVKKLGLLAALLITTFGFSQVEMSDTRDELKLGFKAGVNFANVYDSQGQDFVAEGKAGFAAGAYVAIPIGKFFGIQHKLRLQNPLFLLRQNLVLVSHKHLRS